MDSLGEVTFSSAALTQFIDNSVGGDDLVSFALQSNIADTTRFESKEGVTGPALDIDYTQ